MNQQIKFNKACSEGDLITVKNLIDKVNINWQDPYYRNTPLMEACRGGNIDIVCLLLKNPHINVNLTSKSKVTTFKLACSLNRIKIVEILIKDKRTDINIMDIYGGSPLWTACHLNYVEVVKLLIASGHNLNLDQKINSTTFYSFWEGTTALDIAEKYKSYKCADLIYAYKNNPQRTIKRVRKEINWMSLNAEIFALMIFLSDDFVQLSNENNSSKSSNVKRFFKIAIQIHFDLQLVLVNRLCGKSSDNIPLDDRQNAFRLIIRYF